MVSSTTRRFVRRRAQYRCEYCHSPEYLSPDRFTIDHIAPQSLGGSDDLDNLAFACHRCNGHHYNFTSAIDPVTETDVLLFNPRLQQWAAHFIWSVDGCRIVGTTAIGRATCQRLNLNDDGYDLEESIISSRKVWCQVGWHPPQEDPCQQS